MYKNRRLENNRMLVAFQIIISALALVVLSNPAQAVKTEGDTAISKQGTKKDTTGSNVQKDGWISCSDLASSKKEIIPKNKEAAHDVTFNNCNGTYDLSITRGDYICMYGPGNTSVPVPRGTAYQINFVDQNSGRKCAGQDKYVNWNIQASGGPQSTAKWYHSQYLGKRGTWQTNIQDFYTGYAGTVSSATCDGNACLNAWVDADYGRPQIIIYFQ